MYYLEYFLINNCDPTLMKNKKIAEISHLINIKICKSTH